MISPYRPNQIDEFQEQLKQFRPDQKSQTELRNQAQLLSSELRAKRMGTPSPKSGAKPNGSAP